MTLAKLSPYIKSQDTIPHPVMLEALHWATDMPGMSERRAIANELLEGAGDYLIGWHLTKFITAEISDEEALKLIAKRKEFVGRAQLLLPTLLSLFRIDDDVKLSSALHQIEDCCHDFPIVQNAIHEKRAKKETINKIRELKRQIKSVATTLDAVGRHVDIDFGKQMQAIYKIRNESAAPAIADYRDFREALSCLSFATEIVLHTEALGKNGILVTHNKAKTHIVEQVYSLSLWLQKPPFVTTPGSDFSVACSLLYELASGESDVSLAGAINKFSRSDLRRRQDEANREIHWQNSDQGRLAREADNFAAAKELIAALGREREFWNSMMTSKDWAYSERLQLTARLLDVTEQIEHALQQHGPNLVWASQVSESDQAARSHEMDEWSGRLLRSEVELGRARRKRRGD